MRSIILIRYSRNLAANVLRYRFPGMYSLGKVEAANCALKMGAYGAQGASSATGYLIGLKTDDL